MSKNLVICCDGTNNQLNADRTNVVRMASVCSGISDQVVYYDPGVGTMPDLWSRSKWAQKRDLILGLGMGQGFEEKLMEAYRYLMAHYREGDRIFLFGFSRGAYTARALAALIHSVGLLNAGLEHMVRYAVKYWKEDFDPRDAITSPASKACQELRTTFSRAVEIHFVGVWDTVSSIGMFNHFKSYPHTRFNPSVQCLRQAISIDERRKCFRQNLAGATPRYPDVQNVWFAGVHSDVGGGYPEAEAGLAMLCFDWMLREATAKHLRTEPVRLQQEVARAAPMDACASPHDSLKGGWKVVEWLPVIKYDWNLKKRVWRWAKNETRKLERNAADKEVYVHASVLTRMQRCAYAPVNLPSDPMEVKAKFKILP